MKITSYLRLLAKSNRDQEKFVLNPRYSSTSINAPVDKYPIKRIGKTISFAGRPIINAIKI